MTNPTLAQELAARIVELSHRPLPDGVLRNAKTAILDTVGVTLAGAQEEAVRRLLAVPGLADPGPSTVLGRRLRVSALNAALGNGTASHALDFDDVNIALGGHPSAPLVSALLALTGEVDVPGPDLLRAFVAGFETTARIARGVNFHHYEKGWHPTATLGVFGTAAACALLLRLPTQGIATALAIAASMASGLKANFGTMTKPLHVGHCARNGLLAALLAREGYTAENAALEHRHGFLNVFNGEGRHEARKMLDDWGAPFDIERPGLGIKLYPCCGSAHAAIDAMLDLRAVHPELAAGMVTRVDARIHARRLAHIDNAAPASGLEAKFSVQYVLARALLEGRVVTAHFTDRAVREPCVSRLTTKVQAQSYVNPPPDTGDHYAVEVSVELNDGRILKAVRPRPTGRSPEDPTPLQRVVHKFMDCAGIVLSTRDAEALATRLLALENEPSMGQLVQLMQPADSNARQPSGRDPRT